MSMLVPDYAKPLRDFGPSNSSIRLVYFGKIENKASGQQISFNMKLDVGDMDSKIIRVAPTSPQVITDKTRHYSKIAAKIHGPKG